MPREEKMMAEAGDFFFSPYLTPQERRRRAALQDGLMHGSRMLPRDPAPGEPVTLFFSANATMTIEQVAIYYTTDGSEPSGEYGVATCGTAVLAEPGAVDLDPELNFSVRHWHAQIPGQPEGALVRYRADGWSLHDRQAHWYADNVDPVGQPPEHGRLFAYSVDLVRVPAWLDDAVIYQIFMDRFSAASDELPLRDPGNLTGFFGGTLRGVLEKLDYIQALGVNCIWLSPVFESPSHHGYDPSDYFQVAKRFGTNETLRQLIAAAHERGLRVVLDFVANHTSDEHPLFQTARAHPDSPAAHWYSLGDWPPHGYRAYAQVHTMPELATEHPDVQRYLIDAALHWLGYFGADGLRLDYVPGPSHAFWTIFQREIKQHFPEAVTLGEITESLPEIASYAGRLDAFMDFPLARMFRKVFAQRQASLAEFLLFLDEHAARLPTGMGRTTLLDNHDMHRFLWLAKEDVARLKLAAFCQMTLEGTPIIYYGTEVGLSQDGDAQKENAYARAPMLWDGRQNQHLLSYYRHLVSLRRAHPALRRGGRIRLPTEVMGAGVDVQEQAGAYLRWLDGTYVLAALNNGTEPARIRIHLADALAQIRIDQYETKALRDVLEPGNKQEALLIDGIVELDLPMMGAALLEPHRKGENLPENC
jgi:glycosidase